MKQKICFLFLLLCTAISANATHPVDTDDYPFSKGWFVGAQIGAQYYMSDFNFHRYASIGYGISSNTEAYVGKWLNPVIALRGTLSLNNVTTGEVHEQPHSMEPKVITSSFNMVLTELNLLVDLRYLIRGEKFVYSFKPLMGLGWAFNLSNDVKGASLAFGGINSWKLNKHLDVNVETKFRLLEDDVDGCLGRKNVQLVLNAGLSYVF